MAWADMFYPDPSIPESVKKATMEAVKGGFPSHYTLPVGMYELRCALAEHIHERTGLAIDPSRNVIVTPGSDSGLLSAMMPFLEAGDEVLVHDPSYPSNYLNCKLLGAKAVHVPTWYDKCILVYIEELEKRVTPHTKLVLLTHPNESHYSCARSITRRNWRGLLFAMIWFWFVIRRLRTISLMESSLCPPALFLACGNARLRFVRCLRATV